jgi:flagellar motor component MotA
MKRVLLVGLLFVLIVLAFVLASNEGHASIYPPLSWECMELTDSGSVKCVFRDTPGAVVKGVYTECTQLFDPHKYKCILSPNYVPLH